MLYCANFRKGLPCFQRGFLMGATSCQWAIAQNCWDVSSARIIALTSTGVENNLVLDYIPADLVQADAEDVEVTKTYGWEYVLLVQVVGFEALCSASLSVWDFQSFTANAPCAHRSFTFLKFQFMKINLDTLTVGICKVQTYHLLQVFLKHMCYILRQPENGMEFTQNAWWNKWWQSYLGVRLYWKEVYNARFE